MVGHKLADAGNARAVKSHSGNKRSVVRDAVLQLKLMTEADTATLLDPLLLTKPEKS